MDLLQFLTHLQETRAHTRWELRNHSIRAVDTTDDTGFAADTITFVANTRFQEKLSPTKFLEAATMMKMPLRLAISIARANDGVGEQWIRNQLLAAVGLAPSRN